MHHVIRVHLFHLFVPALFWMTWWQKRKDCSVCLCPSQRKWSCLHLRPQCQTQVTDMYDFFLQIKFNSQNKQMIIHPVLPNMTTRLCHYIAQIETVRQLLRDCRWTEISDVCYVSAGGNWDWGAADTSKSHNRASDRKVLQIHITKSALLDFSMGPAYISSFIIIPLVSLLLKVCRCSSDSSPQSGNVCAVCRHTRHVGLFVKKLGWTLRLFFHQHLEEQRKPDFTALLQSALRGLTSYLS